jgi:hypothetical protein
LHGNTHWLEGLEGVRIFGSGEEIWIIVGAGLAVVVVVVVKNR